MSNLINTYPVFESSQVLTSSQLNQVTSYLDQQNRLTRAKLIGMGIVCGLEVGYDDSGGDSEISISKGTAVTSEGFLLTLANCTTSWVRPYSLPEGVTYAPFDNAEPSISLYELLSKKPEDDSDVVSLDDDPGFLDDKFVLLFLEIFDNDLKACLGNTCDDLGIDRIFTVRKLLISKSDLNELLEHSENAGNLYPEKYDLPDIEVPRTLFNPDADHSSLLPAFTNHYAKSVDSVFTALFGNNANNGALHQTYTAYTSLLGEIYGFENPFGIQAVTERITKWKKYIDDASDPGTSIGGIQYFSDFMKDLVLAYNEFRESAFDLMWECCPDMSRFPRHVMLGRAVVSNETPEESVTYRHGFVQPPIYNQQKGLTEHVISLHKRLLFLLHSFDVEKIRTNEGESPHQIHITPSDEKNTLLSHRSIPWYYDLTATIAGQAGTLEAYWNYEITRKKETGTLPLALGYENQSDDQTSAINRLRTPLFYDLDSYPFLRIEGHLGRHIEDVTERINAIKQRFNLPFDYIPLQLDPDSDLLNPDYSCGFEDLQEEYAAARQSYCGFIRDVMNLLAFASENQGVLFDNDEETDADLKEIMDIVNTLNSLCNAFTACLDEFDFIEFQKHYKESLDRILYFILIEKRLLDEIDIEEDDAKESLPVINGLIQHLSPLVFRITDFLFYNTFHRIYRSFKRREHYLQRQTAIFSNYIRNHPGVQHQAGVPRGGTFIVVYDGVEVPRVVADFNLPYICCKSGSCVPMCDDEEEIRIDIPPFARPDYAITTVGTSVEINVAINDYRSESEELSITPIDEETGSGKVEMINDEGLLRYTPNEEFQGVDRFQYSVTDKNTGLEDVGFVTVLVKEAERELSAGCYPPSVLECWANGDRKKIDGLYRNRHPNNPIEGNISDFAAALHESLKTTGGFTNDELDSELPLEDPDERRLLLKCIDSTIPVDSMEWQELGDRIRQYQSENCGDSEETLRECYSVSILDCWNAGNLNVLVEFYNRRNPNNMITGGSQNEVYLAVLQYLRENNGFSAQEIQQGILADDDQKRKLLGCLGIQIDDSMSSKKLGDLIVDYQNKNCGGGQIDLTGRTRVELSENELSKKEITTVLHARGIDFSDDQSESQLLSALKNTSSGMNFTKAELLLFTKDRMSDILKNRGIDAPSSATKDKLTDNLFRGLQ